MNVPNLSQMDAPLLRALRGPIMVIVVGVLFLIDHTGGALYRLIRNTQQRAAAPFPTRLSETGLFESAPERWTLALLGVLLLDFLDIVEAGDDPERIEAFRLGLG